MNINLSILSLFDEIKCIKTTLSRVGILFESRGMVWKWQSKRQLLLDSAAKKTFKIGSGRRPVLGKRMKKCSETFTIRYTDILVLAMSTITLSDRNLMYSKGWFQGFTRRNKLSYRRITGSVTRPLNNTLNTTSIDNVVTNFKRQI